MAGNRRPRREVLCIPRTSPRSLAVEDTVDSTSSIPPEDWLNKTDDYSATSLAHEQQHPYISLLLSRRHFDRREKSLFSFVRPSNVRTFQRHVSRTTNLESFKLLNRTRELRTFTNQNNTEGKSGQTRLF